MAVVDIITSKTFDNGTICASEQTVVIDDEIYDLAIREFAGLGARSTWKRARNWTWPWWISSPPRPSITEPFAPRNKRWSSTTRFTILRSGNSPAWAPGLPGKERATGHGRGGYHHLQDLR